MKTILAFDYGKKRIGVAIGQTITRTASTHPVLAAGKDGMPDWQLVKQLLANWNISDIIVGVPLNMDGTEQPMTQAARLFCLQLRERFHVPVHEIDERLSTKSVRDDLFQEGGFRAIKKARIDSMSAQLLLEQWMNGVNRDAD